MTGPADGNPDISVVVATHNRAHLLPRLLAGLADQDFGGRFEVIVVDDASTDETGSVLADLARSGRPELRPLRLTTNSGPAKARNLGWRAARAPLVAFTDDDCVPTPQWLSALAAGFVEADLVQGATHPDPDQLAQNTGPFSRTLEVRHENGYYATCNMGYRRTELERLDGFDERFRNPAGEDTDLAWRALDSGGRSAFAEDAVVYHDVRPSNLMTKLRDTARWEGIVLAVREHPRLRDRLYKRWFWKESHPATIAAVVGLVTTVSGKGRLTRIAGMALCAPYVRLRLLRQPLSPDPTTRVTSLPSALVADTAEVAVIARAAVRYKTFLL